MLAGLSEWLDAYGRAWQARDAQAASDLFTEDAVYQWGPFGRKLRGSLMIREAWAEAVEDHANVDFGYEVLTATQRGGLVRWWCGFDESTTRTHIQLEGIFRLSFDDDGLCTSLEEWFNAKSDPLDGAT